MFRHYPGRTGSLELGRGSKRASNHPTTSGFRPRARVRPTLEPVFALLVALLALYKLASVRAAPSFIVFHSSHEGSHGFCSSFATEFCRLCDASEQYDGRLNNGSVAWQRMLDSNPRGDDSGSGGMVLMGAPRVPEMQRGLDIMRAHGDDPGGVVFLLIVRTDLAKWSMSQYFKMVRWSGAGSDAELEIEASKGAPDPQFLPSLYYHRGKKRGGGRGGQNETVPQMPQYHYKIRFLDAVADMHLEAWNAYITLAKFLHAAGMRIYFITYEQLAEGGPDYVRTIFRDRLNVTVGHRQNGKTGDKIGCHNRRMPIFERVSRAHGGGRMRDYAVNYLEIMVHFWKRLDPTFMSLIPEGMRDLVLY